MSKASLSSRKREGVDDNARKFTLGKIDADFLAQHGGVTYNLVTNWLVTEEASEKKVVYKKFLVSEEIQYFLIAKVTENGGRKTNKLKISEEEYKIHLDASILRVEKTRSDFEFIQNGITFAMKYDEFPSGQRMLEVDAKTDDERAAFDSTAFPYPLTEVTGDIRYYGYRIAGIVAAPKN